jgi:anti-sigma regulatory factor (Ser/Thr protein kinase)
MWLWSFAVWTGVSALFSLQTYVWYQSRGEEVPLSRAVSTFADWQLWALFTPLLLCFVWRHPLTRSTWRKTLPWQVAGGLLLPALFLLPFQGYRWLLAAALGLGDLYVPFTPSRFFSMFVNACLTYIDLVLVGHAIHFARAGREEALRRSRLETRLAEAQLQVLRLQLHPHFLFNTLNTISALMHKDLRAADRMLALLGDLLRDSFEKVGAQEVTLEQELGFLNRYLEIEKTRFRDRLTVDLRIDPGTLDAEVPNLLLQPLLENAIRHGIGRRQEAGHIEVTARREHDHLDLRVRDDGPGLREGMAGALRAGVGLANTAARLQQLYPDAHRFDLQNRPEGGLEVVLQIPFRTARRAHPAETPAERPGPATPLPATSAAPRVAQ